MGAGISWTARFEFRTVAANISELFGPFDKPPLAALPLFIGC
jgi:hypothetical protein